MASLSFLKCISASALIALAIVGCQSTTTPAPSMPAAPVVATSQPAPTSTNPRAEAAAQQAAQQAKAIDELLAARTQADAQDRGLTIVEPARSSVPPVPVEKLPSEKTPLPPPTMPKVNPVPIPKPVPAPEPVKPSPMPDVSFTPANTAIAAPPPANPQATPAMSSVAPSHTGPIDGGIDQQLAQRANQYPRDVAAQLDNQLLAYLKDQTAPDAAALGQLPVEDREVITAVIDGLSNFRNGVRNDNNMLMNRKIRPLVEMTDRLKSRADLSITNAMLCTAVQGFGAYTPFEPARLIYGQPKQLAVYCEVQNFASQFDEKNMWNTKLQMDLVLYTNGGMDVWHQRGIVVKDVCRNRRHDFFIASRVTLPAGLAIDQYALKFTITDLNASRVAETTVPVGVVSGQK